MTDHPINPPLELVQQWFLSAKAMPVDQRVTDVATAAARWGADQELEACCEWLNDQCLHLDGSYLRAARRPKPPSLKKQALAALSRADKDAITNPLTGEVIALPTILNKEQSDTIRRALEALDD